MSMQNSINPLSFARGGSADPVWSQDGGNIAFDSNRGDRRDLYRKPAGGGKEELLYRSDYSKFPLSWSSDGRFLLFNEANPKTKAGSYRCVAQIGDGLLRGQGFRTGILGSLKVVAHGRK